MLLMAHMICCDRNFRFLSENALFKQTNKTKQNKNRPKQNKTAESHISGSKRHLPSVSDSTTHTHLLFEVLSIIKLALKTKAHDPW